MNKPTAFGKYFLLERISVGGMAEVFRSKAFGVEGFERLVAVKRILPNVAEDKEFIRMFIEEAKLSVQLNHANIAQIFDLGVVDGSYYIALEHVHGRDLRGIFDRCRQLGEAMPVAQACFIAMKVCEGLDYAHNKRDQSGRELSLVHRDVSPQNILVSFEGEVKLIDFGVAKAAGAGVKTQAGILKGKFGYMSPEQVHGLQVDRRSDVFSCGIVLYELLTGERLFVGDSDFATLEKVRNVEILPPSTYNRKIPDELERIVLKALTKERDDRYQNAIDLHDELQAFVYTAGEFYSRKDLAGWMKKTFGKEIEEETAKLESYRQLKPTGPIATLASAASSAPVASLGAPSVAGATGGAAAAGVTIGDAARGVTIGDAARGVTSGDAARGVTSGDAARGVTSGDAAGGVTSGDAARGVTSGDAAHGVTTRDAEVSDVTIGDAVAAGVTIGDATAADVAGFTWGAAAAGAPGGAGSAADPVGPTASSVPAGPTASEASGAVARRAASSASVRSGVPVATPPTGTPTFVTTGGPAASGAVAAFPASSDAGGDPASATASTAPTPGHKSSQPPVARRPPPPPSVARSQPVPVVAAAPARGRRPGKAGPLKPNDLGWDDDDLETRVYEEDDEHRHRSKRANLPLQPPVSSSPGISLTAAGSMPGEDAPPELSTFAPNAVAWERAAMQNGASASSPPFPSGSNHVPSALVPDVPFDPLASGLLGRAPVGRGRSAGHDRSAGHRVATAHVGDPAYDPMASFGARITGARRGTDRRGVLTMALAAATVAAVAVIVVMLLSENAKPTTRPAPPVAKPAPVVTADPNTGFDLYVTPAGMTQWKLDGESRTDRLPSRIRGIAAGTHTVQIDPPRGFLSQFQQVLVEPGKAPRVEIVLQPIPGIVGVFSSMPAGAAVFLIVDGKRQPLGPSPAKAPLDPRSTYQVLFEKPGYVSANRPIIFSGGVEERLVVTLEKAAVDAPASPPPAAGADPRPQQRTSPGAAPGAARDARPSAGTGSAFGSSSTEAPLREGSPLDRAAPEPPAPIEAKGVWDTADPRAKGILVLGSKPPCEITIDGSATGLHTPQKEIKLAAGRHRVLLTNTEFGIKDSFIVDIKPDASEKIIKDYSDKLPP